MALSLGSQCAPCPHALLQESTLNSSNTSPSSKSLAIPSGIRAGDALKERGYLSGNRLRCSKSLHYTSINIKRQTPTPIVCATEAATSTVVAQEVEFLWKGSGSEVLLTGDFLNWDKRVPLVKNGEGVFQVKQKVPPGQLAFKFIVDGVWLHSPDYSTVADGAGGFNNVLEVTDPPPSPPPAPKEKEAAPAPAAVEKKPEPKAAGETAAPKAVGKGKVAGKKAAAKAIVPAMEEDIIPLLRSTLEKEEGLSDLTLTFDDNQLRASFLKGGVPYAFWCYFPDGTLDGARGFSLATHGGQPSTVEPFLIDERKVLPDLLVFWVQKRLFAQKLLSLN